MQYIKDYSVAPKTLTVGYNLSGQTFFDMLLKYKPYIEEFYFSLKHTMRKVPLDEDRVFKTLSACNTYGIPGNLLLNYETEDNDWERLIRKSMSILPIQSVSVLSYNTGKKIKEKFPKLKIHISTENSSNLKLDEINPDILYCVNLEEPLIYDPHVKDILEKCLSSGVKTKFICNRGCIVYRHHMLRKLMNNDYIICCNEMCHKFARGKYAWLNLCRVNYYKEMMPYWTPDYIKITSREISTSDIDSIIHDWVTPSHTEFLYGIDVTKHYDIFLDWIRIRMTECTGNCYECFKCKDIYDRLIEQ